MNIVSFVIKILQKTFYNISQNDPENKTYLVLYYILFGIFLIIIDFSFLLLWFGIYSSTEVLILLNKLIKNSE